MSNESDQKSASFAVTIGGELNLKDNQEKTPYKEALISTQTPLMDENFTLIDFSLSTTPWFVANFSRASNITMSEFNKFEESLKDEIYSLLTNHNERSIQTYITQIYKIFKDNTQLKNLFLDEIRVAISLVKKENLNDEKDSFINSFFVDDLQKVLEFYENGESDMLLDDYLGKNETDKNSRIDLRDDKNLSKILSSFLTFPDGAFASKYSLMFSQQFAVNEIVKRFSKQGGFYAVNGPPGTGKTTLLKDIIAYIIVERAKVLAGMSENEIFNQKVENSQGKFFYALNESLMGFEIVVSSSNNGAVENISKEIPKFDSIDDKYDFDYFGEFASKLLDEKAWGAACVTLGKSKNVFEFNNKFIWDTLKSSFEYEFSDEFKTKDGKILGFYNYLKNYDNSSKFNEAKKEFNKSLQKVNDIKDSLNKEISTLKANETRLQNIKSNIANTDISEIEKYILSLENKISELSSSIKNLENKKSDLKNKLDMATLKKPAIFWLQKLLSTSSYKQFIQSIDDINDEISVVSNILDKNSKEISEAKSSLNKEKFKKDEFEKNKVEFENLEKEITTLKDKIYSNFELNELSKREKSSPFMKDATGNKTELFEARIDVFIKALDLHKEAILANANKASSLLLNLTFLNKSSFSPEQKALAWKSLFFIIPVVSSTFASFGRFFKDFKQNEIGYLLIDESGQAGLANAVGALFRAKRAVVVGDPLQLEPVVTLPKDINEILMNAFQIKSDFNISSNSVQTRADRVEINGTYLGDVWIGSPLRVHNRCNNPMFEISNITTYDKMMIWGKDKNKNSFESENLKSSFIDVKSENFSGNANTDEIEAVRNLLNNELKNIPKDDIKIISPFRDVVNSLKTNLKDFRENVGTIHTMQGKEAEVIIFVLGGASDGARAWASSKPNLLNVAVSRAKEFLYIVGNKDKWEKLEYFDDAVRLINSND